MITIAVLQQKGGSGKTTLAVNLAAAAHLSGRRTLVLDMDRQGSAFEWFHARSEGSKLDGLDVVNVQGGAGADRGLQLPAFDRETNGYDVVVIDGPPRLGEITQFAAVVADVALLPVQPGAYDFWAVGETAEALDRADLVRRELGRSPVRRALVLNRVQRGTRLAAEGHAALRGKLVGVVHQRVAFGESAVRGESVYTIPGALLAASEIEKLWRALRKLADGSQSEKTKPRKRQSRGE
jgi:chromosome partitioning protein